MSKRLFNVYLMNVITAEKKMFSRAFLLSESRQCRYQLIETAPTNHAKDSILIIDNLTQELPDISMPMVILNQNNLDLSNHQHLFFGVYNLKRPLLATRILRLLDKVVATEFHYAPNLKIGDQEKTENSDILDQKTTEHTPVHKKQLFANMRALIVDDSLMVRKQMELILTGLGVQCNFAENGESALIKAKEKDYHVIFLDIMMPGIDGFQVCKRLRKQQIQSKIIMLTSKSSRLHRARGNFAGVDAYLVKPASYEDLIKILMRYFTGMIA